MTDEERDNLLRDLQATLNRVEERLTGVEERLTGVEERLTGVEGRTVGIDAYVRAIGKRLLAPAEIEEIESAVKAIEREQVTA